MSLFADLGLPSRSSVSDVLRLGGWRRLAVNACLFCAILAVLPAWIRGVGVKYAEGRKDRYREPAARRGEELVAGFGAAVEAVRERVDPAEAYIVAVDPDGDGAITAIAMRLALLPRRPILATRFLEVPGTPMLRPQATVLIEGDATAPVVGAPPEHLPGEVFADQGARDDSIPAAVDEVTINRKREIGIRGWCQLEKGGPCDVEAVLVRGRVVPSIVVDRHPRPDVAAVLPRLGPCLGAGYRVKVPAGFVGPGAVEVQVFFRTHDGRTRTYPAVSAREVP